MTYILIIKPICFVKWDWLTSKQNLLTSCALLKHKTMHAKIQHTVDQYESVQSEMEMI